VTKTFAFFAIQVNGNQLRFKDPHISGSKAVKSSVFWFIVCLLACCVRIWCFCSFFTLYS